MINKGSNHNDITAAIGPSISVKNYEVKKDFKRKFIKKNKKNIILASKKAQLFDYIDKLPMKYNCSYWTSHLS